MCNLCEGTSKVDHSHEVWRVEVGASTWGPVKGDTCLIGAEYGRKLVSFHQVVTFATDFLAQDRLENDLSSLIIVGEELERGDVKTHVLFFLSCISADRGVRRRRRRSLHIRGFRRRRRWSAYIAGHPLPIM